MRIHHIIWGVIMLLLFMYWGFMFGAEVTSAHPRWYLIAAYILLGVWAAYSSQSHFKESDKKNED